jgi:hypothetical protein
VDITQHIKYIGLTKTNADLYHSVRIIKRPFSRLNNDSRQLLHATALYILLIYAPLWYPALNSLAVNARMSTVIQSNVDIIGKCVYRRLSPPIFLSLATSVPAYNRLHVGQLDFGNDDT